MTRSAPMVIALSIIASLFANLGFTRAPVHAADTETLAAKGFEITVEHLAKLDNPWGVEVLPGGDLLISEKSGQLRRFSGGELSGPITGVPNVEFKDQGGLLDVVLDPDYATNNLIYISYTERAETQPPDAKVKTDPRLGEFVDPKDTVLKGMAVARARLEGGALKDVTVIWRQEPKIVGLNHFGGRLAFAPDGKLFITSGDRQSFEPAQDMKTNLGKIIRINSDGTVPDDNPFVGKPDVRPDTFSFGHRNPLGAAVNPHTGQLWIHEMGPKGGDEVNIIEAGKNYGWPMVSEGDNYDDTPIPRHSTQQIVAKPVHAWNPSISPSGLIFYTGDLFVPWQGNAVFGGLSSKALFRLALNGDGVADIQRIDMGRRIRDVVQAPDGAILLLSDGDEGELLRLTPARKFTSSH